MPQFPVRIGDRVVFRVGLAWPAAQVGILFDRGRDALADGAAVYDPEDAPGWHICRVNPEDIDHPDAFAEFADHLAEAIQRGSGDYLTDPSPYFSDPVRYSDDEWSNPFG